MALPSSLIVGVVGLGYVGLPLAVEFGKIHKTIGFDLSNEKIDNYNKMIDPSGELSFAELKQAEHLTFTTDPANLKQADIIIVCVPTPVTKAHVPDLRPLEGASRTAGRNMKKGAIIVYESTVYPGVTEDFCVPILEQEAGLVWKEGFNVGYSPERINPGDKDRTLRKIVKVVAGDTTATLKKLSELYGKIIDAGIHNAPTIKVAEAAKVIENTQRDLNIALMNELSIIFNKLDIDTADVLTAARTKWNFLPFSPGLVGGHCIGVDPYYITHKAEMAGYNPQVILAGRQINDNMPAFVAQQTLKQMIRANIQISTAKIGIMGITFKENCSDIRNSKVVDLINELSEYGCRLTIYDPKASAEECEQIYGINLQPFEHDNDFDCLIAAVPHQEFIELDVSTLCSKMKPGGVFIDLKSAYQRDCFSQNGINLWRP